MRFSGFPACFSMKNGGRTRWLRRLPADAQRFYYGLITVYMFILDVIQQSAALTYHLQQTTPRMVVFFMRLEMLRQLAYPLGKQSYLHFRGSRVVFFGAEPFNYFGLPLLHNRHVKLPLPLPSYLISFPQNHPHNNREKITDFGRYCKGFS